MNAIPPTSALAGLAASTRGATPVSVEQVTPEIARLSTGTILSGTVVSREADGAVHIRTDHGGLVIRTPMRLPEGAEVKIQLQFTGNQTRAVVLSVDLPPAAAASAAPKPSSAAGIAPSSAEQTRPSTAPPPGPNIPAAAPSTMLRPGAIVTAQIVQPPPTQPAGGAAVPTAAGAPPFGTAPASAGPVSGPTPTEMLTLRVIDVVPAGNPARPSPSVAVPSQTVTPTPPGTTPALSGDHPRPAAPPATATPPTPAPPSDGAQSVPAAARPLLAAGQDSRVPPPVSGRPIGPAHSTAPGAPPAPPSGTAPPPGGAVSAAVSSAPAPQVVSGNVMANPGEASTYLATPVGRLMIPAASGLAPNSIVRFEILPGPAPQSAGAASTSSPPVSSIIELARDWPALRELTTTLAATNPTLAAHVADAMIPQAGPRLAQTVLFFISALRLADIGNWLDSRTMAQLRTSPSSELISRISDEFQQIARLSSESSQNDWRAFLVPFHDGDKLQQMRFFHRRYGDDAADGADARGDRFLIDLDLSRLGPMQFDGLLQAKRFSLILRSGAPLDENARQDLRDLFSDGCACAGLTGEISFAGARDFVPLPLDAMAQTAKPVTA